MSKTNMTKQQQTIMVGLFCVLLIIPLVELYTNSFFIQPIWVSIGLFAVCTLNQIFEQKQPLTTQQKNVLLFWVAWTGFILLMGLDAFIAMLFVPVYQMKQMREELEKRSLLPKA